MPPILVISIVAWFGSVIFFTGKMMVDQLTLFKTYRKHVNPPYPIAPGDKRTAEDFRADPLELKMGARQIQVLFAKHHADQELAKLARRVRLDFVYAFVAAIVGFISIALLAYIFRPVP